jgi:hypothetical protein
MSATDRPGTDLVPSSSNPFVRLYRERERADWDAFVDALATAIAARLMPAAEDRWLDSRQAAAHLGMTPNALHKLSARCALPVTRDSPNGKLYFRRA